MQCDLLISSFKNPETIALVKEKIRHAPAAPSLHRIPPSITLLKTAFELKKPLPRADVKLECVDSNCSRGLVSYSSGSSA